MEKEGGGGGGGGDNIPLTSRLKYLRNIYIKK